MATAKKAGHAKTGVIRAGIDPVLKARAEAISEGVGLDASDAIRLFWKQITLTSGLPFPVPVRVRVPNARTRRALRRADAGEDLTRYTNTDEMFDNLGTRGN